MRIASLRFCLFLLALCAGCAPAAPIDAQAVAAVTGRSADDHVLRPIRWNGHDQLFVDYPATAADEADRWLALAERDRSGHVRLRRVTVADWEGGPPEIALIGTVNADADPAEELVVQIRWQIRHYDVTGTFYDTRVFDQLAHDGRPPVLLTAPSGQLGQGCDCERRDEPDDVYRFKTLADIRGELTRLGFAQGGAR